MSSVSENVQEFKCCPVCEICWPSRDAFLSDPTINLVGYQANFGKLEAGYFLFNHSCGDTLSLPAGEFTDLHEGPIFQRRMTGSKECPGLCKQESSLAACPLDCECNFVREVLQVVKKWPKVV